MTEYEQNICKEKNQTIGNGLEPKAAKIIN